MLIRPSVRIFEGWYHILGAHGVPTVEIDQQNGEGRPSLCDLLESDP